MSTERNHGLIGKDALALWGKGDLDGALALFSAAIDACPEGHWALFQYFGSRAGVLAGLGRRAEAESDYQRLLDHAREGGAPDSSSDVALARFFLGSHQRAMGEFTRAVAAERTEFVERLGPLGEPPA
jgi:tetratricopeptide (TPR) repeat protein